MEKMKDCQHQIITWAPGVGGFSVPTESSLLFCFPQVLAFLSLIKICNHLQSPQKQGTSCAPVSHWLFPFSSVTSLPCPVNASYRNY